MEGGRGPEGVASSRHKKESNLEKNPADLCHHLRDAEYRCGSDIEQKRSRNPRQDYTIFRIDEEIDGIRMNPSAASDREEKRAIHNGVKRDMPLDSI